MAKRPHPKPPRRPANTQRSMEPRRPNEPRRALTNLGGQVTSWGEPALARLLSDAWQAASTPPPPRLTHGFHSYPARMHPALAQHLIPRLTGRDDLVLDPFCGSGTVVVESLVAGRASVGADLNPLALRITEVATQLRTQAQRQRFLQQLDDVTHASLERVQGRVSPKIRLASQERRWYAPHVLLELGGLYQEIQAVTQPEDRRALEVTFSSIVVKFSQQRADTSEQVTEKRVRKGLPSEFFARKGRELVERWEALYNMALRPTAPTRLLECDARRLYVQMRAPVALLLTSPPYGGTYDYVDHHQRRLAWLDLPSRQLDQYEVGARRRLSRTPDARQRWDAELVQVLRSVQKMLAPQGHAVLLMGDAQLGNTRVRADEQLAALAPRAGLVLRAGAAQPRSEWHEGPSRLEHLLVFSRSD